MMKSEDLYKVIWMSRPLMQAAEALVEKGLQGTGLTVRARAVLEILLRHGSLSVPDIAFHLEIKRQYVQVMINETLAEDLTHKLANPRHRNSPLIALTEKGRHLISQVSERELEMVNAIGADLDPDDVRVTLEVTLALVEKLKTFVREE
ncbi:MarR family winged helix-turn-helix transcriptional regulator [Roseibium sp.]|uniref:MarR family winged helix-turn-helix transcriptional regulator n=1 Tax=Roseibium sp. TaxID=1936156 RepID=UPI003A979014